MGLRVILTHGRLRPGSLFPVPVVLSCRIVNLDPLPSAIARWLKRFLLFAIVASIVVAALYLAFALNWSYAEGERAGYLQKLSHKGWICKTYEGELAMSSVPGLAPIMWNFSVRDEAVAKKINAQLGKKIVVHYREYRNLPTNCFGETAYFVDALVSTE